MESKNLDSKSSHEEVQAQKKVGFQHGDDLHIDFTSQEMEACEKKSSYWVEEMMPEEEGKMKENGVLEDFVGGCYRNNMAPVDEVCPICFDKFNIPCRTNCGHCFCAGCIMQFWMYRSSIQQCKCPLCCCIINNLAPEMSHNILLTDDVIEVIRKVRQYNGLSIGGMQGLFQKVFALPLLMGRIFRIMIASNGVRCIYYVLRLLGLLLSLLYDMGEYEFIPTGILSFPSHAHFTSLHFKIDADRDEPTNIGYWIYVWAHKRSLASYAGGFGIQRAFHIGASVLSGTLYFSSGLCIDVWPGVVRGIWLCYKMGISALHFIK